MPLPNPHPGLVISYSYLWRHEAKAGRAEGAKDRPSVIILAVHEADGTKMVTVAPITHRQPDDDTYSIELPAKVKEHLGMDERESWVVVDETNQFRWPGYDLRPLPGRPGTFAYGVLPQKLFARITQRVAELWDKGRDPVQR
jgi:mRNA-degrading endonuclease toxin of MazEF toxin-antitoxin module